MAGEITPEFKQAVDRKVFWRIVPRTFAFYIISYIDRANIGYAALQMNAGFALSSEAFGSAARIFFVGYFLFEVPSNVIESPLISTALAGPNAFKAPFWALPGLFLSRSTAAVSITAINSVGNPGGFAGPYLLGLVKGWTGSQAAGLLVLAALLLVSFLMTYFAHVTGEHR
jgi:hypothetical protein